MAFHKLNLTISQVREYWGRQNMRVGFKLSEVERPKEGIDELKAVVAFQLLELQKVTGILRIGEQGFKIYKGIFKILCPVLELNVLATTAYL